MNNIKTLEAMLLLADTLQYSKTFKQQLVEELKYMLELEKQSKQ